MSLNLSFLFIIALVTTTHANDWSIPCTSGSCGYVFSGDGINSTSGSMMLSGSDQILSDITPAAGWQIIDCGQRWNNGTENIRMVCTGTPQQMSQCNHLYANGGPENTVVRLPENCGVGPFARVNSTYVPFDQSLPPNILANNSTSPKVVGLTLDYNFAAIPPERGTLSLAVQSATNQTAPLTRRDMDHLLKRSGMAPVERRFKFNPLGALKTAANAITSAGGAITTAGGIVTSAGGDATSAVVSVATGAASTVASVATSVASEVTSAAVSVATVVATAAVNGANEIKNATTFNEAQNSGPIPINLDSSFPMFNGNINCGASLQTAHLDILVHAKISTQVHFGYKFVGSLVPPIIHDFSLLSSIDGDMAATYHIQAQSQGPFDTGSLILFQQGLPGLSIPGIVTLGPQFTLNGQLALDLDLELNMTVTTGFAYNNIVMAFPPDSATNVGSAQPHNVPNGVQLSTGPMPLDVNGTITGTLNPRIDFGIILGDGVSEASVFLNSVMSGAVDLNFQGVNSQGSNSTGSGLPAVDPSAGNATDPSAFNATDPSAVNATDPSAVNATDPSAFNATDPSAFNATDPSAVNATDPSAFNATDPSTDPSANLNSTDPSTTTSSSVDPSVVTPSTSSNSSSAPPAATSAPPIAIGTLISRMVSTVNAAASSLVSRTGTRRDLAMADMLPAHKRSLSVNGCINVSGSVNITGGMVGSLPPLFNSGQTLPIFSTSGVLLNKCFGSGAARAAGAPAAPAIAQRSVLGGSPAARAYRFAQMKRRGAARKVSTSSSALKPRNEITSQVSQASTSALSCLLPQSLSPLNALQSLI